ncbi:MAG: hypothetical protein H0W83_09710 [Planctomycetes bacterium]|nr:hypothetical protein [Planctomycetota bacterium]
MSIRLVLQAACVGVLSLLALPARAALVDVQFADIKDTPVGTMLRDCLKPEAPPAPAAADGTAAPADGAAVDPAATAAVPEEDPTVGLRRVTVAWEGTKSPPIIRFLGIPSKQAVDRISKGQAGTDTPLGKSWPLPRLPGFSVVILGDEDLVVAPPKTLETLKVAAWSAAPAHALDFTAPATDLKLGDLQDKISDFHLTYDSSGSTLLQVNTPSEKMAKSVDRYIWWRKPVVFAGADVGIKKLKFPARLLDAADIDRKKNVLTAKVTLKDDMKNQAFGYLADAISRELRRYRPK